MEEEEEVEAQKKMKKSTLLSEEFYKLKQSEQVIQLYQLLIDCIVSNEYKESKDAVGKDLVEVVTALQCGLIPRARGTQGHDAVEATTGARVELKTCDSGLKNTANLNFTLPQNILNMYNNVKASNTEIYWAIYKSETTKYDIVLFQYRTNLLRIHMNGQFIAAVLCKYFMKNKSLRINLGGMYCKKCGHIHRLKHILSYESAFLKSLASLNVLDAAAWFDVVDNQNMWNGLFEPQTKNNCVTTNNV